MSWQVFKPRKTSEMYVALSKHHFTLSPKAANALNADNVLLYYNNETKQVKIAKADGEGFTVSKNKVLANRFRSHFGITAKGKYPCKYDEAEGALLIDLLEE
ncbi:MAG: hypothetical protein C4575_10250 [Desulforudis sp.]|jgi:hypothetical protein|nr:hypothetical protein [Clostridia bacterium]MDQ7790516.1 hypothetical protein [Clostridia bacterium]RJX18728.1 MAG: hypothetical protein C4575_10250 [Desulforudis sp.]